ncbi:MAG TPA: hypothetical protein VEW94_08575, partial [Chloroflexia bacterium]|nr:hypothetical protein [Chloroflexia bacterium]
QTPVTIWSALVSQMDQDEKIASTRDWLTVKKWIKTNESTLLTDDRSRIELWAHRVARFSFDAEPTWLS